MIKAKTAAETAAVTPATPAAAEPERVAPLFRRVDWLALLLTFAAVWTVYLLTLAPELTLEDSGELVTGSVYAGIPHPPGYPVWTLYSWLWTTLLPFGNMAWRVAVGESVAAAFACGLLALMVSRGSSLLIEGIEELRGITGKWETAICLVCGWVAGVLVGLDGFMWRESIVVNRIALFSVPWLLLVLACLLRWIYAPHQRRYAYLAAFLFGVCITTHQSLLVAALGFEIALAAGNPRLGRDAFLGNFILYLAYQIVLLSTGQHLIANFAKPGLAILFNIVGIGSLLAGIWLAVRTKALLTEWRSILIMALLWCAGVSFYVYLPISGMTNPPMQWGYPRTVEGFWHALTRGQYQQPDPTNVIVDPGRFVNQLQMLITGVADEFTWVYMLLALVPFVFFLKMQRRERAWITSLAAMYLCLGVLLIIMLNPTPDKASAELIRVFLTSSHTVVACLIGYGLALIAAFLATHYDRFRLVGLVGGSLAVVIALFSLWDATGKHYFGPAGQVGFFELPHWLGQAFAANQYGLGIFGNLVPLLIAGAFVLALACYRQRGPLLITLALFAAMPLYSGLAHWFSSEQRNHWFGYWFGHDMFTPPFQGTDGKPLYPQMTKDAVLFGGTDPGRFCPTYMIFCESFTPHPCQPAQDQTFDRRDVYIITQNALADGTYLNYIRAHYNRSAQKDPPFFSEFLRSQLKDKENQTNLLARMVSPLDVVFTRHGERVEKRRRTFTSWFTAKDFVDLPGFAAKLRQPQEPVAQFLVENLGPKTRQLLAANSAAPALAEALARDLNRVLDREVDARQRLQAAQQAKAALDQDIADGNRSERTRLKQAQLTKEISEWSQIRPLYSPERFQKVPVSEYLADFIKENPQSHTRIRLNRLLLEAAYPKELARSLGGVYPDREIYTPAPQDLQWAFQEYSMDAGQRLQHDLQFPHEPKQVKPGEDVRIENGRIQVSGTVAVMAINGLLTKVIFDHNPKNEFFVEESFPLDWMYPYLTPFGIIMKINRQPLAGLSEEVLARDHEFWRQYSRRLTGDFIDYNTSIQDLVKWIEKTYLRRDFNGFTGDRKFVRDSDGQKAFSKLRSSIAGIYAWRLGPLSPPEYRPKTPAEAQRLLKEAEFALKQSFAFCPFSPEAVFRYSNLLLQLGRFDEVLLLNETYLKFDPNNEQVLRLIRDVHGYKKQQAGLEQTRNNLQNLEQEVRSHPTDYRLAFELASAYLQMQQTNRVIEVLDRVLQQTNVEPRVVSSVAQAYAQLRQGPKLEQALERMTQVQPASPDAWYDLAAAKASIGKLTEALPALARSLELNSARLASNSNAVDLRARAGTDPRFAPLHGATEFKRLVPGP